MPYTSEKPKLTPTRADLERHIPGWGADLAPEDRPAVPKERYVAGQNGAHWDFPDRQVPKWARERSPEHKMLTPVFGTACPPRGLSGVIRRLAYRFSEGRTSHWLLLIFADRVDVLESAIAEAFRGRPDNPIAEYGLKAEIRRHGLRSRIGRGRADVKRLPLELLTFPMTWAAIAGAVALVRHLRRR